MATEFRELLIGCGHSRVKKMASLDGNPHWRAMETLDVNPRCNPDWVCDLNFMVEGKWWLTNETQHVLAEHGGRDTFRNDTFDEIHAYEVLEHLGYQGDAMAFFLVFSEIWRILKPGGHLLATVPSRFSPWLWGDPSHTRAILPETLVFLDQSQYIAQLDGPQKTAMSDFRHIYTADFKVRRSIDNRTTHEFILEAVKPSRHTVR